MVKFTGLTFGFLPFYSILALKNGHRVKRQEMQSENFDWSALNDAMQEIIDNEGEDQEDDPNNFTAATTEDFNALMEGTTKLGAGGNMPCPILPELQSGGTAGFLGSCEFPGMNNNTNFIQVYEDCHGNALPSGQAWYKSAFDFPGKENAMWYAPAGDQMNWDTAVAACSGAGMPIGSHNWCPAGDLESAWLWHHHPNQPFNPYPATKGMWTGINRAKNSDETLTSSYFCDAERYDVNYLNWGATEPDGGKSRYVMMYYMSTEMVDLRPSNTASTLCEINCDILTTCEALNCEAINAVCVDNGDLASSECNCNDASHVWDRDDGTCSVPAITYNIPANRDGMKELLTHVFDDGTSRKRKRRATDPIFNDIMDHGCHCVKMDQDFTGLGGRTTLDTMDGLCQDWAAARRCITLQGGSCENVDLDLIDYQVTINPQTKEMDCTINDNNGSSDCAKDCCYIDTLNAQFVLGELSNSPSWAPITGDVASCPKCNNCVPPAGCRGTAPNVETVSWLDFNQNGL